MSATKRAQALERGPASPSRLADRVPGVRGVQDERAYLYEIIQTIGSGPDLERILRGVVRLVTEATSCHACFIYLLQEKALVLRAASDLYAHLQARVSIPLGEGLTGWVARTRRSAFIKEQALEDPRVQRAYFPELDEDTYQSLVSVPMFSRAGDVIGVITLHAEAPHEFSRTDLEFLEHTAALIAGAAENAALYEEARARVAILTDLSALSHAIAAAMTITELQQSIVHGCRQALGADRCELYLLESDAQLSLRASSPKRATPSYLDSRQLWMNALPSGSGPREGEDAERLGSLLWGAFEGTPLLVPLSVGDKPLGLIAILTATPPLDADRVLTTIASQASVAIKRQELIDRLEETNQLKDLFEELARAGASPHELAAHSLRLGCDLQTPHLVLHAVPWSAPAGAATGKGRAEPQNKARPWIDVAESLGSRLTQLFPGALVDRRERSLRALLPLSETSHDDAVARLRTVMANADLGAPTSVGLSGVCEEADTFREGFEEATSAAEIGGLIREEPGVVPFDELGPYRYLLTAGSSVRDGYQSRIEQLADYDRRRGARLVETLEAYLDRRGNVAETSRALLVHPNTLRQRLGRIKRIAGMDVEQDDWLSIAIALKVVKLRHLRPGIDAPGASDA